MTNIKQQSRLLRRVALLKRLPHRVAMWVCVEMARFHRVVKFSRTGALSWTASGVVLSFHRMSLAAERCAEAFKGFSDA